MIEILVRAEPSTNILSGRYGKGFPVVTQLSPCSWGGCECPPSFVIVRITDTDDTTDWNTPWTRITAYQILAHDPAIDFFRVLIYPVDKKNVCAVTVQEMQDFLAGWGAEEIAQDDPSLGVLFEITAMDAIENKGLFSFGEEDDFVKYEQLSYDPAEGAHLIKMDYSLSKLKEEEVRRILGSVGMSIVSVDHEVGLCEFVAYRNLMIGALETQVREKFHKMLTRVRWRFSDAVVDNALNNGGVYEMTHQEADDSLVDVAEDV